jgi:hypothetical protein
MDNKIVPLEEAAQRAGLPLSDFRHLCERGIIPVIKSTRGELFVEEIELQPFELRDKFKKLAGVAITVSDAAQKYGVPYMTVLRWTRLYPKQLRVIKPGYGMTLDEQDVAMCVEIYRQHKNANTVAPLFDEAGRPYVLKRPDVSAYRKRKNGKK